MTSNGVRSNGHKLKHRKFHTNMTKIFFIVRVTKHWNRLPRKVVHSPSLTVFKKRGDVALRDVVGGHGADGFIVGLGDLGGLFQH